MILPGRLKLSGALGNSDDQRRAGWNMCLDEIEKINAVGLPAVGETWYVAINQRVEVHEMKIVELTETTVVLEQEAFAFFGDARSQSRYVRSKINFLERTDKT